MTKQFTAVLRKFIAKRQRHMALKLAIAAHKGPHADGHTAVSCARIIEHYLTSGFQPVQEDAPASPRSSEAVAPARNTLGCNLGPSSVSPVNGYVDTPITSDSPMADKDAYPASEGEKGGAL